MARAKSARRRARPGPGQVVPYLATFAVLAALFYSVYGFQQTVTLRVGEPSPQRFVATSNVAVPDAVATERQRQAARAQIPAITSVDADAKELVLSSITTTVLPPATVSWLIGQYEQPQGIRPADLPGLIDEAVMRSGDRAREVRLILEQRLMPTAFEDPGLTEAARAAAANAVNPVLRTVARGDVILELNETVTQESVLVLQALGIYDPAAQRARQLARVAVSVLLAAALLALPAAYAARSLRTVTRRQFAFLVGLTLVTLVLQRFALDVSAVVYFIVLVPLLVATLVHETAAFLWAAWLAVVVGLLAPGGAIAAMVATLVAGVVVARIAANAKNRLLLLVAGLAGGFVGGASLVVLEAAAGTLGFWTTLLTFTTYLAGGAVAGILALGLLPLAEGVFEFLTDFRLAELASPQSPLLQRLVLQAPGTFQHSQIIANLVEQSVAQIGGNALLARVGALYHDVGKLRRPQFFAENLSTGENPHDKISPHLSYLIITNHVRDGVELLREHGLPPALEPFVTEHHGTTVLAYFYKRALEDTEKLSELNFRYPGPKPQTKETAVLMLADAVESASRSLSDPTQGAIRALIDRLFDQRQQDDQLSESPLTFRDLDVIATTFERVLTASMHRRVRYPTAEEIKGLQRGGDSRRDLPLPSG